MIVKDEKIDEYNPSNPVLPSSPNNPNNSLSEPGKNGLGGGIEIGLTPSRSPAISPMLSPAISPLLDGLTGRLKGRNTHARAHPLSDRQQKGKVTIDRGSPAISPLLDGLSSGRMGNISLIPPLSLAPAQASPQASRQVAGHSDPSQAGTTGLPTAQPSSSSSKHPINNPSNPSSTSNLTRFGGVGVISDSVRSESAAGASAAMEATARSRPVFRKSDHPRKSRGVLTGVDDFNNFHNFNIDFPANIPAKMTVIPNKFPGNTTPAAVAESGPVLGRHVRKSNMYAGS